MQHRPLTDRDMALISILCEDREVLCGARAAAAAKIGDAKRERIALADRKQCEALRLKMFAA